MNKDQCCEDCIYRRGDYCKRMPPQVVVLENDDFTLYPTVYSNDWCGEFKRLPTDLINTKFIK